MTTNAFSPRRALGDDMDRISGAGVALTAFSTAGYAVGVLAPYPGRAFTITGVMVGLTLWAVGG